MRPKCKVIVSNIIYLSDNGKASLTVNNINDHLDVSNTDVVDNRNIDENCLTNGGLHLNSTGYGKLAINFIKKRLSVNIDGPLTVFVVAQTTMIKFLIK